MASFRKRNSIWYYRYVDEHGKQVERKGCASRVDTEGVAYAAVTDVNRIKSGFASRLEIEEQRHPEDEKPLAEITWTTGAGTSWPWAIPPSTPVTTTARPTACSSWPASAA
jgi:hypothetical protein